MAGERRDHVHRIAVQTRVLRQLLGCADGTSIGELAGDGAPLDAAQRIVSRLARRNLVRCIGGRWFATEPLRRPQPVTFESFD